MSEVEAIEPIKTAEGIRTVKFKVPTAELRSVLSAAKAMSRGARLHGYLELSKLGVSTLSVDGTAMSFVTKLRASGLTRDEVVAVPITFAHTIASQITTDEVEIEAAANAGGMPFYMRSGKFEVRLHCLESAPLEARRDSVPEASVKMRGSDLKHAHRFIAPIIANSKEDRPALMGCFVKPLDNSVVFVGTDGSRLAQVSFEAEVTGNQPFIIPRDLFNQIGELSDGDVVIEGGKMISIIDTESTWMHVPNFNTYPNVDAIVNSIKPKAAAASEVQIKALTAAIARTAAAKAAGVAKSDAIKVEVSRSKLDIDSHGDGYGMVDYIPVENDLDRKITAGMSNVFLRSACECFVKAGEETVMLSLISEQEPVVVYSKKGIDKSLVVIMPMKL